MLSALCFRAPLEQALYLLADLHDAGLAQRVPEVVGHQVLVHSQVTQECLGVTKFILH